MLEVLPEVLLDLGKLRAIRDRSRALARDTRTLRASPAVPFHDSTGEGKAHPDTVTGTVGFHGVSEEVWNFHIGGYQVCEKWLKDHAPKKGQPGRTLTAEDIAHYHRIVIALHQTIRIMGETDEVIDAHGGWPAAFETDDASHERDTDTAAPTVAP